MKRRFRSRPSRAGSGVMFTFHSYGTHYSFDPEKIITDDRIVNEANYFESMTQLEFYKNELRATNAKHVYILDNKGNEVLV